jgi:hypothetical protein
MAYEKPALAVVLQKANWEGHAAQLGAEPDFVALGEALARIEAAYAAVAWEKLEFFQRRPSGEALSPTALDALVKAAVAEMKGGAAKLRSECFAARDLAKTMETRLRLSDVLPRNAADLCAQIAKAADFLGIAVNQTTLGGAIDRDAAELRKPFL